MSCAKGQPCEEGLKRRAALAILGLMGIIFLTLSTFSFVDSRGQVLPRTVAYAGHDAVAGKRIFQAYNCMGCHTVVGNGAYFGPDLTKLYGKVGAAWIEAFLPSAGSWPTSGAVKLQLQNKTVAADAGLDTIEAYTAKYPGAAERLSRRGGRPTLMPNLPLSREEVDKLVAFLKYTSEMNTEGWPPVPEVNGLAFPQARPIPAAAQQATNIPMASPPTATQPSSEITRGEQLAKDNGCIACHAPTGETLVGPGWGGLYGSTVKFADGSSAIADENYLTESILKPDAKIVAGFEAGVMPSFAGTLGATQVSDIVAYIRSLKGRKS
jgi:mono/diheme cytochrome c family protein